MRYIAVGATTFALDFGVLAFLREMLGATLWASTSAGFGAALLFNFTTQRSVTFRVRGRLHSHLLRYVVVLGINYLVTVALVLTAQAVGIGYAAGKVVATVLLGFTTFFAYKHWVFSSTKPQPAVHDDAC